MNKQLFILFVFLLAFSCNKENDAISLTNNDSVKSTIRTEEMAISELNNFLNNLQDATKSSSREILNIYRTSIACDVKSETDCSDQPDALIVNFKNNEGFAIISGDTRVAPILAVTDYGNLNIGDVISNPSVVAMLEEIDIYYRMTVGMPLETESGETVNPIGTTSDGVYIYPGLNDTNSSYNETGQTNQSISYSYSEWENYTTRGQIIGCEWGQNQTPYNLYTYTTSGEKALAGCVPTAVAQILYFYGKNFTMDDYYFDWSIMRNHKSLKTGEFYSPAYEMIGELYYKLGKLENLNVKYGVDASSANSDNVPRTFKNCGLSNGGSIESYNYDKLYNKLAAGPVYVAAYAKETKKKFLGITVETTYSEGHAWVIDQVLTRRRTKTTHTSGNQTTTTTEYEHLVHCNFGWNGFCNGYYYSAQFDTNAGPVTKSYGEEDQHSGYYQFKKRMNVGITR